MEQESQDDELLKRVAIAMCEADNRDPHKLIYEDSDVEAAWLVWQEYIPKARAAVRTVVKVCAEVAETKKHWSGGAIADAIRALAPEKHSVERFDVE